MADIKIQREDVTLTDWTKGMSVDEYAWGSYFYAEWIQSWYSTKGFKLWPAVVVDTLNERTNGYPLAICPCVWTPNDSSKSFIAFTNDWCLEMSWVYNGSTYWIWWDGWWWALYCDGDDPSWVWWFVYGKYALVFKWNAIKKIEYQNIYDIDNQIITNPRFRNDAAWWTVGTGWIVDGGWMYHNDWYTWTLSTDVELTDDWYLRYAVKVTWCTAGNVTVSTDVNGSEDVIETEAWRNWWFIGKAQKPASWTQTVNITVTPSSDFNWTVGAVNLHYFDYSKISTISITSAFEHHAIERQWNIYVSSGDTIDIISTVDRTKSDSKQLVWAWEEIIALTQWADSIIIWTTDRANSYQYYRNWVDSVASEVITWEWQVIRWVTGTETINYVLTSPRIIGATGTIYRLYSVSWYQRSLIASNAYQAQNTQRNLVHYHPTKKFVFNDTKGSESMCIYLDNLYLPWCDWIYQFGQTLPWLSRAWTRPIKYETWADKLFLFQFAESVWFAYTKDTKNYYASLDDWNYQSTGYLVTDSIYWDKIGTRKALEKMKLGYKSLASNTGNIKIYAIVDDDYFWRFDVTWITNRPELWDIYQLSNVKMEVINIEKTSTTAWEITFRTTENKGSNVVESGNLSRVTWDGDATITWGNYDNMCLIKTIETENQWYGADLIFGKDFVNNYLPYWHKIQLVIELNRTRNQLTDLSKTPEIYELSIQSDIADVVL